MGLLGLRRMGLLLLIILVSRSGSPEILAQDEVNVVHGRIRYREVGPSAVPGGVMSLLEGAAAPVYIARLQNLLTLLLELPQTQDISGMKEAGEWMNKGIPVNLAEMLPISSHYWAELEFDLEGDGANFKLASGRLRWGAKRSGNLSYNGAQMNEAFSGQGTYVLDPAKDKIELRFDVFSEPPSQQLLISLRHPLPLNGESSWSGPENIFKISMDAKEGIMSLAGEALGKPLTSVGFPSPLMINDTPFDWGIDLAQSGRHRLNGIEVWRTISDSEATLDYDLYYECGAAWEEPKEGLMTFDEGDTGTLEVSSYLNVTPFDFGSDLGWTMPEIDGSRRTLDPGDPNGWWFVDSRFEGLPADNNAFGEKELMAEFQTLGDQCKDPPKKELRFLYSREAMNNPDGDVPNWFYYWKQTRAGQGHAAAMEYDPNCTNSEDRQVLGHYNGYVDPALARTIYICNLGNVDFTGSNMLTSRTFEGIDLFGRIVLHEWTHLENYWDWWGKGGYRAASDRDDDDIPDDREAGYGLSPILQDTLGLGYVDSEYPAYLQDNTWIIGSADKEDWANPGKQSGE